MVYSVELQASVSVRLYIPRTVLGDVNNKVTEIVKSNHLNFEGISNSFAILLPDTQDFYSLQYLSQVLHKVSSEFIKECIPHSLFSMVNDRTFDHYLYWITKDLEEIGRECDVPNRKIVDTINYYPKVSLDSPIVSLKMVARTYEDAVKEFNLNVWEEEDYLKQKVIYPSNILSLNQRELREAFLAKKLLDN